ncbi:hypothetical protein [Bacillus sp. FJAT-22090]|uniref:hypothetical protein n=1 Tax=Bacillus sp. FJAT-22090 TaxID=1581038 RepID=UPI00119CBEDB|nr:hypothetical protein [Bacillus sp. FJAT-22090]
MKVDTKTFRSGGKSGLLKAIANVTEKEFATMMQSFQAKKYKRKRIKLSGYLKTENATKCIVWMQIDNQDGDIIQFDNMNQRSIKGSTEWNQYSIVLDVPKESSFIHFGVLLRGRGKV